MAALCQESRRELVPGTAAGSRCWRTGSSHTHPGWRTAGPGKTPAGFPAHTWVCVCVLTLTWLKGLSQAVSSTHTLHQVESLFREKMLFAMRRETHCLPKLALRENNRLSDTHSKEIYNKTRLEKALFRQSSQLESEAPPSAHLGSIWPSPGFPCQKRPVGC